jgi:AraC family transcriptional regulator
MTTDHTEKNYRKRVSRVIAAIVADPMAEHSLAELAAIAHFSPFHFHRIYRGITGETVAATVRRVRLARAAQLLGAGSGSVTRISMEVGYDSPQAFSRAFQQFTGMPPRDFQRKMSLNNLEPATIMENLNRDQLSVTIVERPALRVQALRHHGPTSTIPHVYQQMHTYVAGKPTQNWLGIIQGDPEADEGYAYYAAVCGLGEQPIHDNIELLEIQGGQYASYILHGPYTQINAAMTALYNVWLPQSGYEPDDRPALENYLNSPENSAPEDLRTELLIPIRPLLE